MRDSMDALVGPVRELREEFVAMTEPVRPALWRYALRLTGSPWDAEDLVQETLLRAFGRLANFWQPIEDVRAYLFRIASNAWIDGLRRSGAAVDSLETVAEVAAPRGPDPAEVAEVVEELIRALPPRQRAIVLLTGAFDFTAREVAAMLGCTEGAVKAALHRARATLRSGASRRSEPAGAPPAPDPLLERFVDAFNRHDPDAIAALLEEHAATDIVGVAEEHGREVIRQQSIAEGMASPIRQRAAVAAVAGEPVVAVFADLPGRGEALMWLIRLSGTEGRICRWTAYFFTPELIRHAAAELGLPAAPAGYRYAAPAPPS
ncbi:MAG TPA: sigma-70 family RNA polymerase sigma factor [Longimicrobiales bacterium]|nr:sigma-70 family RNA polymerase sigma factor [Longimicrobiales bacterium]